MLLFAAMLAAAQPADECLAIGSGTAPISLDGRLERRIFPGPPNFRSIRRGDRPEPTYILVLNRSICVIDSEFGNPNERFRQIQLFTSQDRLWPALRGAVGRRIRVSGQAFAAHTGHHREPLVVDVSVLSRVGR